MYTEFLSTLAEIAQHLDRAAKIGGDPVGDGMPTPYLYGSIEVRLEGEPVGRFEFEDEWVQYYSTDGKAES